MGLKKGQVFSIGAIIFSSLLLLTVFAFQGQEYRSGDTVKNYFSNLLEKQPEVLNQQLKQNYSAEKIERKMYSFNRFAKTASSRKGLEYSSFQLLVLPEKEKALFINYRPNSTTLNFTAGTSTEITVQPLQNRETGISPDISSFKFYSGELDINETVEVDGPTLIGHMHIWNSDEEWRNYIIR